MFITQTFAGSEIRGDYTVLTKIPKKHSLNKVVLEEFMNFSCPHCFNFHQLSEEMKNKTRRVEFVTIPLVYKGQNDAPVRLFYVADSLGKGREAKKVIFEAKYFAGVDVFNPGIVNYLARSMGIGKEYQEEAQKSWITEKIKENDRKAEEYGIDGTPTVVLASSLKFVPMYKMEYFVDSLKKAIDDLLISQKK